MPEALRRVAVILVDRANYGRLKPVMRAIADHPDLAMQVIAGGTMVLERFDRPVRVVRDDGFEIAGEVYVELEGSTPTTMAKSLGFAVLEFAGEFQRLDPDIVVVIGDRYEALAATLAAAYMNKCIVHIQGGEVSGSIDENARHAITKFAHFHVPSTRRSAEYLIRMGERPDTILDVGCPSTDLIAVLDRSLGPEVLNVRGSGALVDPADPFLLAMFHPTTTFFGAERDEVTELLEALDDVRMPTVLLWPNIDAGSDHVSKAIRVFRDQRAPGWLRLLINLTPGDFLRVLANASCAVGNSSSFVRDSSALGTPVVLIGNRQDGRETGDNVIRVAAQKTAIADAVRRQIAHGRYLPSDLYGDGKVSTRVANAIAALSPYVQKRLHYVMEQTAVGLPRTIAAGAPARSPRWRFPAEKISHAG